MAPSDSLARATRIMRAREVPALLIAEDGRLVGMVHERDIAALAASSADPTVELKATTAGAVMRPLTYVAQERDALAGVVQHLHASGEAAVGVAGADGRYRGLLLGRDVLAALAGEPFVPPIAGLATPLGVHLTTGALRAGPGNLGLMATGAALMVINLLAVAVIYGLGKLLEPLFGPHPGPLPKLSPLLTVTVAVAVYGIQVAIFFVLFRLSPLASIHAAEHMVVHAIEAGEDLTLEKVRPMERVHARCGTNLVALLVLLLIAFEFLTSLRASDEVVQMAALFALLVIILFGWRRLGAGLQRWVTTRRPSDRQLARAIRVGEQLLDGIRRHPGVRVSAYRRIWNIGFLQVMAGFFAVQALVEYAWPWLRDQLAR